MIVGVPREVKDHEYRVALTPGGAEALAQAGHQVLVEQGAGVGSGFPDQQYAEVGAKVVPAADAWGAEMVLKVKEPQPSEYPHLREGLILFTYLHLAAAEGLGRELVDRGVTGVAYETVELPEGTLPLLTPMSEVAGRMAVQVGAQYLEKMNGGRGVLLGGVAGVRPADVVILGGGVAGTNAAQMALGLGANVTVINRGLDRLRYLGEVLYGRLTTLSSLPRNVANAVAYADLLIGSVLIAGARAPRLVTREMVRMMKPASVIVDISIDQGGCIETSRPTTHSQPTYVEEGVIHYCVTNMPGAVPRTSTYALSNATLPYALALASKGFLKAVRQDPALARGVNTYVGRVTHRVVAEALREPYYPLANII